MNNRRTHRLVVSLIIGVVIAGVASCWVVFFNPAEETTDQRQQVDTPENHVSAAAITTPSLPESPYLNARHDVDYVGSSRCVECHPAAAETYRQTGMGRSFAVLAPGEEPGDAIFDHPESGRRYQVYRHDGELRHREVVIEEPSEDTKDDPVVLADHAIGWVIGSGRHSRSYLLEIDGFLVQSPITWYSKRQAWGMSPGYDAPRHHGFSRPVDKGCLFCHAGQVEAIGESTQRIQVHESWISCERCHGPGSLHVNRHLSGKTKPSDAAPGQPLDIRDRDETIVNQKHLDRDLSESICAQCHLRSAATVIGRGWQRESFRPGLPLSSFRADYRLDGSHDQMTVVGHVDQLRQSRCWQKSQLTCTSCHNPHAFPDEANRDAYYRAICLDCHSDGDCSVDTLTRQRKSPQNNCVTCHMPASETEIPHLAFTHHRIGVHDDELPPKRIADSPGLLVAITDLSKWSEIDRRRMLGLANLEFSESNSGRQSAGIHRQRAFTLLSEVWDRGLRDSETASALTALSASTGDKRLRLFANSILENPDSSPDAQLNGLLGRALDFSNAGEPGAAARMMEEVVKRRRVAGDWMLLAEFQLKEGKQPEGARSMERALSIDALNSDIRIWLIDYYQRQNATERAEWHRRRLSLLEKIAPPKVR